jgi:hypothetical protein
MTTPTDDDIETFPETELLALPGQAIPPGLLTAFFTRRAELLRLHVIAGIKQPQFGRFCSCEMAIGGDAVRTL